jgi:hypothetical protein
MPFIRCGQKMSRVAGSSGRGSVLGKTLEGLPVGGVPGIEMFPAGKPYRSGQCFFVRPVRKLQRPISPGQNIDGRRMHLAMDDNVARMGKALAHKAGKRTVITGRQTVRFGTGSTRIEAPRGDD